jgi:hypothetical protein
MNWKIWLCLVIAYFLLCLAFGGMGLMGAWRIHDAPRWEVGCAFQPRRWALAVVVSFYREDRGVALYVGPLYLYAHLGAAMP